MHNYIRYKFHLLDHYSSSQF